MDPQKIEVEVRPRDVFKHYVHIQRPGDILQWSFYTKKKNLAFGLYYLYLSSQHPAHLANSGENLAGDHQGESHELGEDMSLSCEFVHEVFSQSTTLVHIDPAPGNPPTAPVGAATGSKLRRNSYENLPQNDVTTLRIPSPLGELVEILPIEKYPTFETTIRGSLDAPITGTYVLVFDNSFSINTSKHLIFTIDIISNNHALRPLSNSAESLPGAVSHVVFAGWLLKKKRRKIQGWSRRWFSLEARGMLIYHWERGGPCKGAMVLADCSFTKVPQRWLIVLDSGNDTFHLKALSQSDYDAWTEKISAVRNAALESSRAPSHADKIQEQISKCQEAMNSLKRLAEENDNGEIPMVFLEPLECTLGLFSGLFESLQGYSKALLPSSSMPHSKSFHSDDELGHKHPQQPSEEELFYDVDEIVISDLSESEYAPGDEEEIFYASREETVTDESLSSRMTPGPVIVAQYRTSLPVLAGPCTVSIASILRKSIGKDSSSRSMPIGINEPLSALQRMCEELEYCELLDKAWQASNDPALRVALIAAFAVSSYSSMAFRAERKPFNPMLGETFEWTDGDLRFIGEKVSHRPITVLACHAERLGKWKWWQDQAVKNKNWGKSIEYIPSGTISVQFDDGSCFEWSKVISCLRNIWSSDKTIENYGDMIVKGGDYTAVVNFKSSSFFGGSSENQVAGYIIDANEVKVASLRGRWDDHLILERNGDDMRMLWKANPLPPSARDYFLFSYFALRLNAELTPEEEKLIPFTDSRRRPDQRLLEYGRLDEAEAEKSRIEDIQRKRRAKMEEAGQEWKPAWFSSKTKPDGSIYYEFTNRYWEEKLSIESTPLW
jgi:oxysterol-binding protein-related protein 3/6/7